MIARIRDTLQLYRIYRQCNGRLHSVRMAWIVARD